ncbi:MAG: hypothetical protein IK126_02170 [Bacteroidales bacterium]|nr:hypothetical protein [Bacteroidales bacterium]
MIYLFDEKTGRRTDYGWSDVRISGLKDYLRSFSTYDFIAEENIKLFAEDCDVVFIHESFFNGVNIEKRHAAKEIRQRLFDLNRSGKLKLVVFAGSKFSRKSDANLSFMPVSSFYQNLAFFIEKYKQGDWSLEDIVYGKNRLLEKQILIAIDDKNDQMYKDDQEYIWNDNSFPKTLLVKNGVENQFDPPTFFQSEINELFYNIDEDDPISDVFLHNFVKSTLAEVAYEKVYIPACFGPTLSDFNGLRLALHVRTTTGPNQFSTIYIYSPVEIKYMVGNDFFDILKTLNVYLVNYSCKELYESLLLKNHFSEDDIRRSLSVIQLRPPKNYVDSHSVANEWAISRWAYAIGVDVIDDGISDIIEKIEYNIYYKYLNTIHPINLSGKLEKELIIKRAKSDHLPKVLLVDDEADKGWYEIFCNIIYDKNGFDFFYLDDELDGKGQDEIITIVHNKVIDEDIDIVLLDFRLLLSDFSVKKAEQVTGMRILKDIKHINPGIQVIVISATNKVWNLRELQKAGADGFVLKESPVDNVDNNYTIRNIESFIKELTDAVNNHFKKEFYNACKDIIVNLSKKPLNTEVYESTIEEFRKQIELLQSSVQKMNSNDKSTLDISFINCYNIFEMLKYKYLKVDKLYRYSIGDENGIAYKLEMYDKKRDEHYWQSPVPINNYIKNNGHPVNPTMFDAVASTLIYLNIAQRKKPDMALDDLWGIVNTRNNFIHKDKKHFTENELMTIINLCKLISKSIKP